MSGVLRAYGGERGRKVPKHPERQSRVQIHVEAGDRVTITGPAASTLVALGASLIENEQAPGTLRDGDLPASTLLVAKEIIEHYGVTITYANPGLAVPPLTQEGAPQ